MRAAGDQAHLANDLASAQRHQTHAVRVQMHLAVEDVVDRSRVVAAAEQPHALLRSDDATYDGKLAQTQRFHVAEEVYALLNGGERLIHAHSPAGDTQRAQPLLQNAVIGGLHGVTEQMLDDFVTLVHRLLDERVSRQGADDEHAGHEHQRN